MSKRPQKMPSSNGSTTYDVIVVGGGMAGLTASAYLARAGHRVLLCEKEPVTGGLVQSFERDGFTWDAGIRAVEDSGIIFPMLDELGIDMEFVRSPVSLGIEDRVIPVETQAHLADYQALLEYLYPEARDDIARILDVIRRVMKHMDVLYGIENPAFKDLRNDRKYVFGQLLPWLGKFLLTIGKINRMDMPVDRYLETLSTSRPLIDMISQHFFRQTPTFFALSYFSLYLDYVYPRGGTGELPRAVESYCSAHGVDIRSGRAIRSMDLTAHTVADDRGSVYRYRKLIWAADLKTLYRLANIDALPRRRAQERARARRDLLEASIGGDSVFTLYMDVDRDPSWFADRSNGHFFYTPSRAGVGENVFTDLSAIVAQAKHGGSQESRAQGLAWIRRYIESTTYEISIPVLKDASLAPPGKTGLIVSVLFDHALCDVARAGGWYEELKSVAGACLVERLNATIYPGVQDALRNTFSSTPLTIQESAGTSEGAITGWAFTNPVMPAVRRMQRIAHAVRTELPDVYQAGQWTFSPSGLPIAILTGKLAADRTIRDLRRR